MEYVVYDTLVRYFQYQEIIRKKVKQIIAKIIPRKSKRLTKD